MMAAACHFRGGRLLVASVAVAFGASENCFFRMSAYDWLVALYTGLSRRRGRREDGGSMSGGMDFLISTSRFSSNHARASGRLVFVVTTKHLLRPADSIRRNHDLQRRCSCNEIGSVSDVLSGSMTANQAAYSKFTGIVATWFRKKLFSWRTCA